MSILFDIFVVTVIGVGVFTLLLMLVAWLESKLR